MLDKWILEFVSDPSPSLMGLNGVYIEKETQ